MWKGLPRTNTLLPSLFRAFVNYGCKKFYNIGPLADIWDSRSENIFPNSSATAEEVTFNQFHKHFILVTYGPTKISCSCRVIHWRHHAPMQCFENYFDTAVSYTCKMFMKSTPGSRNFMIFITLENRTKPRPSLWLYRNDISRKSSNVNLNINDICNLI